MNIVVMNKEKSPHRKIISATFSRRSLFLSILLLIERKESRLLSINIKIEKAVNSSMSVFPSRFNNFREVRTIKQIPSRFEEVVSIE
jgi:hypothetical protein